MGIVPAAGLAQGIVRVGAAGVPAGTELPAGTVPARGIDLAEAVLSAPGIGRLGAARGIDRAEAVLSASGIGRVRGTARPWAGRGTVPVGIGRLGAGPSCGCS